MRIILTLVLACASMYAQTILDSPQLKGNVNAGSATKYTLPGGSSDPATCAEKDVWYNTTAHILKVCTATNTWSAVGTGSGLPTMTGQSGKLLTTNGTAASWMALTGGVSGLITVDTSGTPYTIDFSITALNLAAQTPTSFMDLIGGALRLPEKTFATLPTASLHAGKIYKLSDSTASTACSTAALYCVSNGTNWIAVGSSGSGGDASTNTSSSVDSEVALFSGTGGKTLKRATGTGYAVLTSGVLSVQSKIPISTGTTGWKKEIWPCTGTGLSSSSATINPAIWTLSAPNDIAIENFSTGTATANAISFCYIRFPYSATDDKYLVTKWELPDNYDSGTAITVQVDYTINQSGSANGTTYLVNSDAYCVPTSGVDIRTISATNYGTASVRTYTVGSPALYVNARDTFTLTPGGTCSGGSTLLVRFVLDNASTATATAGSWQVLKFAVKQ